LTTVADRAAEPESIADYQRLLENGKLTIRLFLSANVPTIGPINRLRNRSVLWQNIRFVVKSPMEGR
jgi:hypothetical protein